MLKYVVAMLCGVSLSGSVYMAGWGSVAQKHAGEVCEDCCVSDTVAVHKGEVPANLIDVKNTKCIVEIKDIGENKGYLEYKGKAYHICCDGCDEEFKKDPEKYVKALEADPAKYGVKVK